MARHTAAGAAQASYAPAQKWAHWLIALLILVLIPVGLVMVNLPDGPGKDGLYDWHKSFGITVFMLALARVLLRLRYGAPPLPASLPGWQRLAAGASHIALYILIILVPLLGFIGTSMCCAPIVLFGLIPIDIAIGGGMDGAERVLGWHKVAVFTMAGIIVIHAGAALMHGFVWRDGVLQRMLPRREG